MCCCLDGLLPESLILRISDCGFSVDQGVSSKVYVVLVAKGWFVGLVSLP